MTRWERFHALERIDGLIHGFTLRQPGIGVREEREVALARLEACFTALIDELGFEQSRVRGARQVHGAGVVTVAGRAGEPFEATEADGVVTAAPGCALRILVADCCAVYLVDPVSRVLGLVHSGRKGSELGIARVALERMEALGADPGRVVAQLSPCIGPPLYEVDFAALIRRDLVAAGVPKASIHGPAANTGANLERYYSYRMERGRTGRMMALLGWGDGGNQ